MAPVSIRSAFLVLSCAALFHCGGAATERTAGAIAPPAGDPCAGISDDDRAKGPLSDRSRIEGASDLVESVPLGKTSWAHVRGAKVVVRSEPGLTGAWLTRLARCHVAMRAAGAPAADAALDPLAVGSPEVTAFERDASLVVIIRGRTDDEGREIARRARHVAGL